MLQIQFTSDWYKIEVKKSNKQKADLSPQNSSNVTTSKVLKW